MLNSPIHVHRLFTEEDIHLEQAHNAHLAVEPDCCSTLHLSGNTQHLQCS
jgi:hypothetical protein